MPQLPGTQDPSKDVDFLKAVRDVRKAQQKDSSITPEDADAYIKQATKGRFGGSDMDAYLSSIDTSIGGRNLARSAVQGAAFNWADEIAGLVSPAFKEDMRLRGEMFAEEHPAADVAAGVVGGIGTTLATLGLAAPEAAAATGVRATAGIGRAALAGARTGALAGAAAGAGAGEGSTADIAKAALAGGVGGAVLGGGIGAGAGAASKWFKKVPLGTDPATGKTVSISNKALTVLQNAVMASKYEDRGTGKVLTGEPAVRAFMRDVTAAGRGDVALLADASSPLRNLLDTQANNNPELFGAVKEWLGTRQSGMVGRLQQDFKQGTQAGGMPFAASEAALPFAEGKLAEGRKALNEWANEAYGSLRAVHPSIPELSTKAAKQLPPEAEAWLAKLEAQRNAPLNSFETDVAVRNAAIDKNIDQVYKAFGITTADRTPLTPEQKAWQSLVQRPVVQDALRRANKFLNIRGGIDIPERPTGAQMLDFRSNLSDAKEMAFDSGQRKLGWAIKDALKEVDNTLEEYIPGMKDVNAEYARRSSFLNAMENGTKAWDKDSRVIALEMGGLTPEQQGAYRYGLASRYAAVLEGTEKNRDIAARLSDPSDANEARLRAVFGSDRELNKYLDAAAVDAQMAQARGAVGGSPTHLRGAATAALNNDIPSMLVKGAKSTLTMGPRMLPILAMRGAANGLTNVLSQELSKEITYPLMRSGTPAIDEMLKAIMGQTAGAVGPGATKAAPMVAGQAAGSMFGRP